MATMIPQQFIDDLLERVDIVEVIDQRVKLKKSGKNYSACCPFHDEKTPSFTVSPDKQFFYCFGCGASGNSLGFIMDYERLSFPEAIESLAKLAGLNVPRQAQNTQQKAREQTRKTLYNLMEASSDYFQQQLRAHTARENPVSYLKNRGLTGAIAKGFGIGFAPPGWDNLLKQLGNSNENQDLLLDGGMLIKNEEQKRLYDRFRNRIMFPIRDTRGRVIGFGGRVLGDDKPKYLNSPETPIFHKGKELYGLYEARQAHRQLPRLLVVEGYMDVVALAQFDIRYGVATLGTACGLDHLQRAFRFTNEVVFCFDGDEAGRKAARRAMENSLEAMQDGRQIKFLYLPDGEDPDTLIRQIGADKFTRLIESASPLEHFLFDELSQGLNTQTMEGRARLCKLAAPLLDKLPRGVYRELIFGQLAKRTQLSVDALMTLVQELPPSPSATTYRDTTTQSARPQITEPRKVQPEIPLATRQGTPQATIDYDTNTPPDVDYAYDIPPEDYSDHSSHSDRYDYSTDQYSRHDSADTYPHTHGGTQAGFNSAPKTKHVSQITPEDRAIALLLYEPSLAQHAENLHDLDDTNNTRTQLLINLVELLQQRPEFSSGQILGHWQGTYGISAAAELQQALTQAALFHQARELSQKDEERRFNPAGEFTDTIGHIHREHQQRNCDTIIAQLNQKPFGDWSDAEKQLYRKAMHYKASNH